MATLPFSSAAAKDRQATTGLLLGGAIAAAYLILHIYAVFFLDLSGLGLLAVPFLMAALCWLNVGLFIVAHDCMHGSLAPGRPIVVLIPDLLRFSRTPGKSLMLLVKRNPMRALLAGSLARRATAGEPLRADGDAEGFDAS